jgi:hypothetical protein
LQIDRTSCSDFWANQFRVLLTAAAYVLLQELRLRAAGSKISNALTISQPGRKSSAHRSSQHASPNHSKASLKLIVEPGLYMLLRFQKAAVRGNHETGNQAFSKRLRFLTIRYLLKESLDRLWSYTYEGAMLRYLKSWIDQLRWQRLRPMEKLARMLLDHLEGILNYCRIKVPLGVVEAVNGNIKALLRRGRGYRDLNYLLLKAQRLAATKTEFVAFRKAA